MSPDLLGGGPAAGPGPMPPAAAQTPPGLPGANPLQELQKLMRKKRGGKGKRRGGGGRRRSK